MLSVPGSEELDFGKHEGVKDIVADRFALCRSIDGSMGQIQVESFLSGDLLLLILVAMVVIESLCGCRLPSIMGNTIHR